MVLEGTRRIFFYKKDKLSYKRQILTDCWALVKLKLPFFSLFLSSKTMSTHTHRCTDPHTSQMWAFWSAVTPTWTLLPKIGRSEVQSVVLELQPRAVLTVELTEPAPVLLDGWVLLHQERLGDVLLIIPDHHVTLKLCTQTQKVTGQTCNHTYLWFAAHLLRAWWNVAHLWQNFLVCILESLFTVIYDHQSAGAEECWDTVN